jgi:hypothetical protein
MERQSLMSCKRFRTFMRRASYDHCYGAFIGF